MARHKVKDSHGNWHWFNNDEEYKDWQNKNDRGGKDDLYDNLDALGGCGCFIIIAVIVIISIVFGKKNNNEDSTKQEENSPETEIVEYTNGNNSVDEQPVTVLIEDNSKIESVITDTSYFQTSIEESQENLDLQTSDNDSLTTNKFVGDIDDTTDIDLLLTQFENAILKFETASFAEYESAHSEVMTCLSKVQLVQDGEMSRKQKRQCRKLIERLEKELVNYNKINSK